MVSADRDEKIRIANYPISMGGWRAVYLAEIKCSDGSTRRFVVKQYIDNADKYSPQSYVDEAYNSALSSHLATKFSRLHPEYPKIDVIPSQILTVEIDGIWQIFNMEQVLDVTRYQKWMGSDSHIISINKTLLDFSIWTLAYSKGRLMISDLQGVENSNGSIQLTDTVILSKDDEFSMMDCGEEYIDKCINSIISCYRNYGLELPHFYTKTLNKAPP